VNEYLGATVRWSDEAEASIFVPTAQGTGEGHLCEA
jgi:hypothetical protein